MCMYAKYVSITFSFHPANRPYDFINALQLLEVKTSPEKTPLKILKLFRQTRKKVGSQDREEHLRQQQD